MKQRNQLKGIPVALPGMSDYLSEREQVLAVEQAEQLTAELASVRGSIEAEAGVMVTLSPLFRGTAASPQAEMFAPQQVAGGLVSTDDELEGL